MYTPSMLSPLILLFGLFCVDGQQNSFMDDRGREFIFEGKPKIAVRAGIGALSLYHFGMGPDQIVAVWGLWGIRGTDLDVNNPDAGSIYYDADPTAEEVEFLKQAINLSPGCYTNPRGCFQWDNTSDVLAIRDQIDYIVYIDNGSDGKILEADAEGIPVIFIDTFFDYNPNCRLSNFTRNPSAGEEDCVGRSMIDIAQKIEDLAIAMGVDVNIDQVNADKQAACEAAEAFTNTMEAVHAKGIRVKACVLGTDVDANGNTFVEIASFDPIELWVMRSLEELGMPMLHASGASDYVWVTDAEYFLDCSPGFYNDTCNSNTLFPVDYWLIDSRSYRLVTDELFSEIFPDKVGLTFISLRSKSIESHPLTQPPLFLTQAILAGQHWHFARNDGPVSFVSIRRMLEEMTTRFAVAERFHERTDCTDIDPKSLQVIKAGGGLDENEYICYNAALIQQEYLQCPPDVVAPSNPPPVVAPTESAPTVPNPAPTGPAPTASIPAPTGPAPTASNPAPTPVSPPIGSSSGAAAVSFRWTYTASVVFFGSIGHVFH